MTDSRERNLYIVQHGDAIYIHTLSKAALNRVETSPGATLIVAHDGDNIRDHTKPSQPSQE